MSAPETYKDALRVLLQAKGKPVEYAPRERWSNPHVPETSLYGGWLHYEAHVHASVPKDVYGGEGCWWVLDPGAEVTEDTFTEWGGTFGEDTHQIGINVTPARCACGKYTGMTLRYEQSLSQTLRDLLGAPVPIITL